MGLEQARRAIEHAVRVFLGSTLSAAWSLVPGSLDGGECAEFCVEHENCHRAYEPIRALERAIERTIRNTTGEAKAVKVNHGLKRTRVRICQMFREEVFEMPDKWVWTADAVGHEIRRMFPKANVKREEIRADNVVFTVKHEMGARTTDELHDITETVKSTASCYGLQTSVFVSQSWPDGRILWVDITNKERETIFDRLERKERECERDVNGYSTTPRCGKVRNAAEAWRESGMAYLAELGGTPEANAPHTFFTKRLNMDEPRLIIRDELADWTREQHQKKTEERKMIEVNEIVAITEETKAIKLVVHKEETEKELAMTAQVAAQYQRATVRKVDVSGDVLVLHVGSRGC